MKKFVILAAVWLASSGTGAVAQLAVNNTELVRVSGEIRGAVQCASGDPAVGALVYIPGESFMAKTDEIGEFTLRYVPEGIYDVMIEVAGQAPNIVPGVRVTRKTLTRLSVVPASCQPSCTPSPELCDGKDNDCDGQVDEGFALGLPCDGVDGDLCNEGMTVCDPTDAGVMCSDNSSANIELCNSIDDNCNGAVDEGGVCSDP